MLSEGFPNIPVAIGFFSLFYSLLSLKAVFSEGLRAEIRGLGVSEAENSDILGFYCEAFYSKSV